MRTERVAIRATKETKRYLALIKEYAGMTAGTLLEQAARDEALGILQGRVMELSDYGDPDDSLFDWLAAGDYDGSETPESIALEWDSDRD